MLEARGLTLWRGEHLLLDAIDLQVSSGQAVQVSGPNGSGKTSLLRSLVGLLEFDEGEVLWEGKSLPRHRQSLHAGLIYVGHKSGIAPELTAVENLAYLAAGQFRDEAQLADALAVLGLATRLDLPCSQLSAGQRRRVVLARLLVERAQLWVLDEPLTSLDQDGHDWVATRMAAQLDAGGAVLFTSHTPIDIPGHEVQVLELGQ